MSRPRGIMKNQIIHQIIDESLALAESGVQMIGVEVESVSWHETPVITVRIAEFRGLECNAIWLRNYSPDDSEYHYTPAELLSVLEQIRDAGFRAEDAA